MDIEKLKSIIRLANNNPNDNEANLAARKACKILAENDFAIFNGHNSTAKPKGRAASREPEVDFYTIYEEMMRKQREAAKRNEENARRKQEEARKRTDQEKREQHRRNWEPFNPFRTRPEADFRSKFWHDPEWFENDTKQRQQRKDEKKDKEIYQRCYKCRNMKWGPKPFTSHLTGELKEFHCFDCLGIPNPEYTKADSQYKKQSQNKKICPRCGFPIYFNFEQRIYKCDNAICNMVITEKEWANIGK